ncbi:MAG: AraC family transcriptional regulator [Cytophagales bacterium]|nr:AraC family transcriptional regulator [Cytophagales bacterium]
MALPTIVQLSISNEKDLPKNFQRLFHTHLFCHRGRIQFLFNDEKMECKANHFLFWFAESRLSGLQFSKNFKATVLLVEKKFLTDNVPDQSWGINAMLYSRIHPVKEIELKTEQEIILTNFDRLHERFLRTEHRFYDEALKLQMQLFILEMWNLFAKLYENRKHTVQTGTHYEQFTQLLKEHCLQQREVQFYSDKLHITPKYLNHLCKTQSGVTASEWIQRHARERIIILLQSKRYTISEIADEMEFSSRSFFTRYVKKLLGVTPSEYRARLG